MKYGSTVRIEVRGLWDNEILFSEPLTISRGVPSDTLDEIHRKMKTWFNSAVKASELSKDLTDEQVLAIARTRGLIPHEGAGLYANLYFVRSRSGKTEGHYIELFIDGKVTCSCPGWQNNGKCWASTTIKDYPSGSLHDKWAASRDVFYIYRNQEYPDNKNYSPIA